MQLTAYMVKTLPKQNQHRYYFMTILPTLFGDWSLIREWGRVGSGGRIRVEHHITQEAAIYSLLKWKKAKSRRGYEEK